VDLRFGKYAKRPEKKEKSIFGSGLERGKILKKEQQISEDMYVL